MNTVQDIPLQHRKGAAGLAVVAWGKGRMRPGTIESIGPKNARVSLIGGGGRPYSKAIPHAEVFVVPDAPGWRGAAHAAELLNEMAAWQVNRRRTVDWGRAHELARAYGTTGVATP